MANRWIDSFARYDAASLAKTYSRVIDTSVAASDGPRGGRCLKCIYTTSMIYKALSAVSGATGIVGARFYIPGAIPNAMELNWGGWGLGKAQTSLQVLADGSLQVKRGASTGTVVLGTSPAGVVSISAWYYIEMKVLIDDAVGTVDVWVNGAPVTNLSGLTGLDTQNVAGVLWNGFCVGAGPGGRIADVYVNDGSGGINDDAWGDTRVDGHFAVTPAGTNSDWSRSAGSDQYENIDEDPPDDDTTYNYSDTVGHIDTVNVEDFKNNGANIYAVQLNVMARKDDAGSCGVTPIAWADGTPYGGTEVFPPDVSYRSYNDNWDLCPDGDVAWDATNFNAMEWGYKKTT